MIKKLTLLLACSVLIGCSESNTEEITTTTLETNQILMSCLPTTLQQNVLSAYNFGNSSINDVGNGEHHLTYSDEINTNNFSFTTDRYGNENCAIRFTPTQNSIGYLKCVNADFLNGTENLSISFWIKRDVTWEENIFKNMEQEVFSRYESSQRSYSLKIFVHDLMRVGAYNGRSQVWDNVYNEASVHNWQHVVVNYNKQEAKIDLYLDGIYSSNPHDIDSVYYDEIFNNYGEIQIGKRIQGSIDDMFIFNRNLTPTEIIQMKNVQPCCN